MRNLITTILYYADILEILIGGTRRVGGSVLTICDDIQKTQKALDDMNNRNLVQK